MDQFLTALISPIVALLGGVIISGFGVALGGAARYGFPPSYRRSGGWMLAGLGVAIMLTLTTSAAINETARAGWLYAITLLAVWFPGFVAASLGASRWILAGSVLGGMAMSYAIFLSFAGVA